MAQNPVEDFVLLEYQSAFATHTMMRPTNTWTGTPWDGPGTFLAWDDNPQAGDVMVEDFVDLLLPMFKPDTTFTGYSIYHVLTPGEPAIPVWAENYSGKIGTSIDTTQSRAWERTYTFRTTGSHIAKICLLDTPCGGLVSRYNSVGGASPDAALIAAFCNPFYAWSGRANERPVWFKTLTTQPNAALEHKYGLN